MRQTILFTAAAATLRSLLASQHGQCQRPKPVLPRRQRSRSIRSRFLRSVVLPALSPGHHPGRSTIVPAGLGPAL
jgi:hypothetical protein